ncbi:MAG: hypothetical protein BZ138_00725 [Methanosphaera sp. rholeuAM270]|nr:MAG: hypothetical protein BZ138_00725 [Methanosphaera sp. rholeuAM270]
MKGLDPKSRLIHNKKEIKSKTWAKQIIQEISEMNRILELEQETIIKQIQERIENPEKTYSHQLNKIIENQGFIPSQLKIAKDNKKTSQEELDITTIKNNRKYYEIYTKSLPNNKN